MYHGKGVIMLDQNTQQVLNHAMSIAESYKHELVSIEHILLSLTQNMDLETSGKVLERWTAQGIGGVV